MQDLKHFPFDIDALTVDLVSMSNYELYDESKKGQVPVGKTYRLRPVERVSEGTLFRFEWNGVIPEWTTLGISHQLEELPRTEAGTEHTRIRFSIWAAREWHFYFFKALVPLYMLTYLSTIETYQQEIDNTEGRSSIIATYFLAAFAMLYVVGESLPRLSFLTNIDKAILLSTIVIVSTGTASHIIKLIDNTLGREVATSVNLWAEVSVFGLYILGNVLIFLPALIRQRRRSTAMLEAGHGEKMRSALCSSMIQEREEFWPRSELKFMII